MPEIKRRTTKVPESTPLPQLKDFDRLTCHHTIHHEHRGESPKSIVVGHSRMLKTKDEVYQRRFTVSGQWKPIDLGWVIPENVGCVVIENLVGKDRIVNPTKEELEADNLKILEVSYTKNSQECDCILPGSPDIKWPADATRLHVRCQSGEAICRITIIPK